MYNRSVVLAAFFGTSTTRIFRNYLSLVKTNKYASFSERFSGFVTSNESIDDGQIKKDSTRHTGTFHKSLADEDGKSRISSKTKTYALSAEGKGTLVTSRTTLTGHSILADLPKLMGGSDRYAQPVEHLLAALVSCEHVTAIYVGRSMSPRLLIDRTEWEISAVRDERGALQLPINEDPPVPSRLQQIVGQVIVYRQGGLRISKEELKLLKHQTEIRCPIANMIAASGCEMEIDWKAEGA
jgi:uncharacterized OsmC-like protein